MNGSLQDTFLDIINWIVSTALHVGTEFLAFVVLTAVVAGFGVYFGRDRILPLLAGLYTAIPLYQFFPFGADLLQNPLLAIALYLILALLVMIAFSGLSSLFPTQSGGLISLIILSAVTAGMLIAISIQILPVENIYTFSAATKALFDSAVTAYLWFVAPIIAVFFLSR